MSRRRPDPDGDQERLAWRHHGRGIEPSNGQVAGHGALHGAVVDGDAAGGRRGESRRPGRGPSSARRTGPGSCRGRRAAPAPGPSPGLRPGSRRRRPPGSQSRRTSLAAGRDRSPPSGQTTPLPACRRHPCGPGSGRWPASGWPRSWGAWIGCGRRGRPRCRPGSANAGTGRQGPRPVGLASTGAEPISKRVGSRHNQRLNSRRNEEEEPDWLCKGHGVLPMRFPA